MPLRLPRLSLKFYAIAAAALFVVGIYRAAKAFANNQIDEFMALLRWLAWRDARLEDYDPPEEATAEARAPLADAPKVDALVVHGCSMVKVVQGAADLFVDVLHPAGCRVVLLTGGVGRETPPLWGELRARKLTALFGYDEPWARGTLPPHVSLPLQGVEKKPVLSSVELTMPPDELRAYCSEADVFLELFAARCAARGLSVEFGGNPMADTGGRGGGTSGAPRVFLETASTHTGTNVEYSRATLAKLGLETPTVAVVQQPQLHLRTCLTWHRQTGQMPIGWTIRPTADAGRSLPEQLRCARSHRLRMPHHPWCLTGRCSSLARIRRHRRARAHPSVRGGRQDLLLDARRLSSRARRATHRHVGGNPRLGRSRGEGARKGRVEVGITEVPAVQHFRYRDCSPANSVGACIRTCCGRAPCASRPSSARPPPH